MCVHAYTSYCSQACVYMSVQLCISIKTSKNSIISGNWDLFLMSLGQWWGLQELVSRCAGRLICSELDHIATGMHLLCPTHKRKWACSWLHFCICNIHWHPHLPYMSSSNWDTPSCGRRCLNWTWCLINWTPNKNNVKKPINSPMELSVASQLAAA